MNRWLLIFLTLAAGMVFAIWLDATPEQAEAQAETAARSSSDKATDQQPPSVADLAAGKLTVVDLARPLNPQSVFWPGDNYHPFALETIATLEKDGVLSKAFSSPEHVGTHIDAPNHFERDRPSVDQIPAVDLFAPGVVVDVEGAASADPDYLVSLDDIHAFEQQHGQIPEHAVVLTRTGWGKFYDNPTRYQGRDVMGRLHFPGFSPEAVRFLIDERHIRGVGLDTMSVDHGLSRDFPVHHLLGKASCYGLENLTQLDKLPAAGFFLFVAPMKIAQGTGGPTRVFAVLPNGDEN